jgi:hypothetical protein
MLLNLFQLRDLQLQVIKMDCVDLKPFMSKAAILKQSTK